MIGILAVQGAFAEHQAMLESLGAQCVQLRCAADITPGLEGIVLPGGESTVQGKLLHELGMYRPLESLIQSGVPVLATCAGLILLAQGISNDTNSYFATLPVTVRRNAYGRQLGSFVAQEDFAGQGKIPMHFIRAPAIESCGEGVEVLAETGGKPVAVRYKNQLALAFHPEVSGDTRIHRMFIQMVRKDS